MLKEIVNAYPDGTVSLHVVWVRMVPGDSKRAARSTGAMFAGHQVHQYYDGKRVVGAAYMRDVFPDCLRQALNAMPEDHPLYEPLSEQIRSSQRPTPLWDAVLFYPSGVRWANQTPRPVMWLKQAGFAGGGPGEGTDTFFRNDCAAAPVESDWHDELRQAMSRLPELQQSVAP